MLYAICCPQSFLCVASICGYRLLLQNLYICSHSRFSQYCHGFLFVMSAYCDDNEAVAHHHGKNKINCYVHERVLVSLSFRKSCRTFSIEMIQGLYNQCRSFVFGCSKYLQPGLSCTYPLVSVLENYLPAG